VPDVEAGVDPMSCSKLYSIPLTMANSWSSTTDMSRLCSIIDEGDPGRSIPSNASSEYVIPLTCSTRDSWTVPKCNTVPSAGLTCLKSSDDSRLSIRRAIIDAQGLRGLQVEHHLLIYDKKRLQDWGIHGGQRARSHPSCIRMCRRKVVSHKV
jgi:hypothetical protein